MGAGDRGGGAVNWSLQGEGLVFTSDGVGVIRVLATE